MLDFGIGTNASNYKTARLSFSGLGVKSEDLDISSKLQKSFMFTGKALRKLSMSHEEIICSEESNKIELDLKAKSENAFVLSEVFTGSNQSENYP